MAQGRIVVEESPLATFFNQTIPNWSMNLLQLQSQIKENEEQRVWQSAERQLDRDAKATSESLTRLSQDYRILEDRKFQLEDKYEGFNIPEYVTPDGTAAFERTISGYTEEIGSMEEHIDKLQGGLKGIRIAEKLAGTVAAEWSDAIKASKDERWKDMLMEGNIKFDEKTGAITGTDEMGLYLQSLEPEEIEKFKDENYRLSFQQSLGTAESAMEKFAKVQQFELNEKQISLAGQQLKQVKAAIQQNEWETSFMLADKYRGEVTDAYKNVALEAIANFNYGGYGVGTLMALAPEDLQEVKEDFMDFEDHPNNRLIAGEAEAFFNGLIHAQMVKADPSMYIVKFQKAAYEDWVDMLAIERQLSSQEGKTITEALKVLPKNDPTVQELNRLRSRVKGFKSLGLYRAGLGTLNQTFKIVEQHQEFEALMLGLDATEAATIAREGLTPFIGELEDYDPESISYLSDKQRRDLEISLAAINASSSEPDPPADPNKKPETVGEKAMTIPIVRSLGWTADKFNQLLFNLGADIYNVAGVPINYITYLATGYNPGFKGTEVMDKLLGWTGAGPEDTFAARHPDWQWAQEMGDISLFGSTPTPRGQFSWDQVEDSLNVIEDQVNIRK